MLIFFGFVSIMFGYGIGSFSYVFTGKTPSVATDRVYKIIGIGFFLFALVLFGFSWFDEWDS
jgi:hypothetical protein